MGLGSKLKTLFADGESPSASPPRNAARRVSASQPDQLTGAQTDKARPRSWSASNSRRLTAAELPRKDLMRTLETPVVRKHEALSAAGVDTNARPSAPDPADTIADDTVNPRPQTSELRSPDDHVHAHPAFLQHEGEHVVQDRLHLKPVVHETVRVLEIEEVTRQTERHRHVHHVQHHIMPIRLTEEVEFVEHGGFLYAHTGEAHAHEDFIRLKALVGEHEEGILHTPKTTALADDGTLVDRRDHVHVHRIVRPLTVQHVAMEERSFAHTDRTMSLSAPAMGGMDPALRESTTLGRTQDSDLRVLPGAYPESVEGAGRMTCGEEARLRETVCTYDDDGCEFAEVGELLVQELADAGGARGKVL